MPGFLRTKGEEMRHEVGQVSRAGPGRRAALIADTSHAQLSRHNRQWDFVFLSVLMLR